MFGASSNKAARSMPSTFHQPPFGHTAINGQFFKPILGGGEGGLRALLEPTEQHFWRIRNEKICKNRSLNLEMSVHA